MILIIIKCSFIYKLIAVEIDFDWSLGNRKSEVVMFFF